MTFRSDKRHRLEGWDYSSGGCYHVVFCTKDRRCMLGRVDDAPITEDVYFAPSAFGEATIAAIAEADERYSEAHTLTFAVMPNHVHLLVQLDGGHLSSEGGRSVLSKFVGFIKGKATRLARAIEPGITLWQPRFYDHVIRGEADFQATWMYIESNPAKWKDDEYFNEG